MGTVSQVGQIILEQMGGARRLAAMLGAQFNNVSGGNGVGIRWPNRQLSKGNYVEVIYSPGKDLYDVTFYALAGGGKKPVKKFDDIYAEDLVGIFERQTGWYLHMATRLEREWGPLLPSSLELY